jgi:hypothetical protein
MFAETALLAKRLIIIARLRRLASPAICLCALFSLAALSLKAGSVGQVPGTRTASVQNIEPRTDSRGEIIDAHDGCLQYFEGRYFLYGTAYGRSAGFGINNRFRVYSSLDLSHWQFEGELLKDPPPGVHYRPYVAYNPNTHLYVLWYNWYPRLWDGKNGVAVSSTPIGPFKIVNPDARLTQAADHPGDGSLFVDHDGTGYFIYTVIGQDHAIRVERLTRDYLGSAGKTSEVLAHGCEAPAMFRRGDTYYVLFDTCSCFGPKGSGARVYVSSSPLGPFEFKGNINRGADSQPIVSAQQTYVARIPTTQGDAFIWMGDLWGSRPDTLKGHDLQYWSTPLEFLPGGAIAPLRRVPRWQLEVRVGLESLPLPSPYVAKTRIDPNPLTIDPCSGASIPIEHQDRGS